MKNRNPSVFLTVFLFAVVAVLAATTGCDFDFDDDDEDVETGDGDDDDDELPPPAATVVVDDAPDGNPLARRVVVTTDRACSLDGFVTAAAETGYGPGFRGTAGEATQHVFWFFGLLADTTFTYTFHLEGDPATVVAAGEFATPPLPDWVLEPETLTVDDDPSFDEWYITWVRRQQNGWEGTIVLYDRRGRVRLAHNMEIPLGNFISTLDNGDVVYGGIDDLRAVRPDGTEYIYNPLLLAEPVEQKTHHQYYLWPDRPGEAVVIFNQLGPGVRCDGVTPTDQALGDGISEVDAAGNEVWRWSAFDHQDRIPPDAMDRINCLMALVALPGDADWTHANSVYPTPDRSSYVLSFRHVGRVIRIDRATGGIVWQMGPGLDFTWVGAEPESDRWFYFQHDVHALPGGRLLMFDNGVCRDGGLCLTGPWSRALELQYDETEMTVSLVWEHRLPFSQAMGNVQRSENGNTLIGSGTGGRLIEVTPDGRELINLFLGDGNGAMQALYYPPLWVDGPAQ